MKLKSETKKRAEQLLSTAGLRKTNQRLITLAVLLGASEPLNQHHITEKLGSKAPDKVTIYRTLETFVTAGIVHKAFLRDRTWHFELSHNCTEKQCHPHFTCTNCGDTYCLMKVSLPIAKTPDKNFVIHRQQVSLEGLCPKCSLG